MESDRILHRGFLGFKTTSGHSPPMKKPSFRCLDLWAKTRRHGLVEQLFIHSGRIDQSNSVPILNRIQSAGRPPQDIAAPSGLQVISITVYCSFSRFSSSLCL